MAMATGDDAVILADGFSCRTQIHELDSGGREGMHLAELLAAAGRPDTELAAERPETTAAPRPTRPGRASRAAALTGAALAAGTIAASAAAIARLRRHAG